MKKILVTGSFTGAVVVMYGEPGMGVEACPPLLSVDVSGAHITDEQKYYMLTHVPLRYGAGFEQAWGGGKLIFVTDDVAVEFERDFWLPYAFKVNKKRCEAWWKRASRVKRTKAVARLGSYLRHLERNQWKNKANPETYLSDEYFETDWDNV